MWEAMKNANTTESTKTAQITETTKAEKRTTTAETVEAVETVSLSLDAGVIPKTLSKSSTDSQLHLFSLVLI